MKKLFALTLMFLMLPLHVVTAQPLLHHDINVKVQPLQNYIIVSDQITLPNATDTATLFLHAGLNPEFFSKQGKIEVEKMESDHFLSAYRLSLPENTTQIQLNYQGKIHHALSSNRAEQSRGFRSTAGIIDKKGVFLAGGSFWYPRLENYPTFSYSMNIELPADWSSVSQGKHQQGIRDSKTNHEQWTIEKPQEEIYLIAAPFSRYEKEVTQQQSLIKAQVFLRQPDQKLADKYLDATAKYLKIYQQLLGPYAYSKFALVENFWETGFGMPSFTLLGSRVIRLPFILHSSYPHEILHNWWGNGVYVDFDSGNWSEGLTAYLADHLIKEQRSQGSDYRLQSLQKYRDYAAENRDFPLSEFKSRHSAATAAVGYGKTMMLFHMLRKKLGDDKFIQALRDLYGQFQFQRTSFTDIQKTFEQASGDSLDTFFEQWVKRVGAPELVTTFSLLERKDQHHQLTLHLSQSQAGDAYSFDVPIAVTLDGEEYARKYALSMTKKEQTFDLDIPGVVTRVDIDPEFDLFRKLDLSETPPAFTEVFGANELIVVLPSKDVVQTDWREFAQQIRHMGPEKVTIVPDSEIQALPKDSATVVLGWGNHFANELINKLEQHPISFTKDYIQAAKTQTPKKQHAFAWVTRSKDQHGDFYPQALITADMATALPGLARKLPHYHKYSYLAFTGNEPQNTLKERWPVNDSPMSHTFQQGTKRGKLIQSKALIEPQ